MFDQDEAGRKAADEVAQLLSVGKAYIATPSLKDINEMLLAGKGDEAINAVVSEILQTRWHYSRNRYVGYNHRRRKQHYCGFSPTKG